MWCVLASSQHQPQHTMTCDVVYMHRVGGSQARNAAGWKMLQCCAGNDAWIMSSSLFESLRAVLLVTRVFTTAGGAWCAVGCVARRASSQRSAHHPYHMTPRHDEIYTIHIQHTHTRHRHRYRHHIAGVTASRDRAAQSKRMCTCVLILCSSFDSVVFSLCAGCVAISPSRPSWRLFVCVCVCDV